MKKWYQSYGRYEFHDFLKGREKAGRKHTEMRTLAFSSHEWVLFYLISFNFPYFRMLYCTWNSITKRTHRTPVYMWHLPLCGLQVYFQGAQCGSLCTISTVDVHFTPSLRARSTRKLMVRRQTLDQDSPSPVGGTWPYMALLQSRRGLHPQLSSGPSENPLVLVLATVDREPPSRPFAKKLRRNVRHTQTKLAD